MASQSDPHNIELYLVASYGLNGECGRPELAEKELSEIGILEKFLPQPLSAEELEALIQATVQELGATSKKEMGPVIKTVQAKAAGRADGKSISTAVGKLLG